MNTETTKRRIPTAAEVLARQKADADRAAAIARPSAAPAKAVAPVPANARPAPEQTWDTLAPGETTGMRAIKFDKTGQYVFRGDNTPIPENFECAALVDQMLVGAIKFNGEGEPPDRIAGLPYAGFRLPAPEDLPDRDETTWLPGLSGTPEDPWKYFVDLPLQQVGTGEMFVFQTQSKTGRRAVANLGRHFDRMVKLYPEDYPVVKLQAGGYQDKRFGWVATPTFVPIGKTPRAGAATPPDTSPANDMDDQIPF
jgi:hypothetical protein